MRYIGVDTPETVKPDTPVQCFGPRASRFNHRLVEGRRVRLVFGVERRDVYGRLLAYVVPRSPLRQRRAGPPRPRAHADDPAERPLRSALFERLELARPHGPGAGLWGACPEPVTIAHLPLQALRFATVPRGPRGHLPMRMRQSISQFETAFEQETILERRRREQLRRRAANRSRARRITRTEQESKVRFSVLAVCLTVTVVVVVVAMFEALAFLMA